MYKALISFGGIVSMHKGEIKEIKNEEVAKDLLNAHYIEEVRPKTENKKQVKPTKKEVSKSE